MNELIYKKQTKDTRIAVRVSKQDLETLKKHNVDVAELVRQAMKKAVEQINAQDLLK